MSQKHFKEILRKTGWYFPNLIFNSKLRCISTSLKKNSILSKDSKSYKKVTSPSIIAKLLFHKKNSCLKKLIRD